MSRETPQEALQRAIDANGTGTSEKVEITSGGPEIPSRWSIRDRARAVIAKWGKATGVGEPFVGHVQLGYVALEDLVVEAWGPMAPSPDESQVLCHRLVAIEAQAEVLIVARHDLMVDVDRVTGVLRDGAKHAANEVTVVEMLAGEVHEAADLLDRLAAYMKGQDDRLIAMGDKLATVEAERDEAQRAFREVSARKERVRVVTSPRFYSEAERRCAADEVSRIIIAHREGTLGRRCLEYVDAVAATLGMRRLAQ